MIRISTVILICLGLSVTSFSQKVEWIRACLDVESNIKNLDFVVSSDCENVTTRIYGEKVFGSGFNLLKNVDGNGIKNVSLGAQSISNWRLYLVLVDSCNDDSVIGDIILIDNTPPQNVGIDSVSVSKNGVLIGWTKSTSNDVKNYILYYNKGNGFSETLDTVSADSSSYLERSDSIDAEKTSVTYRIAAIDSCNIGTGQVDAHSTMFLNIEDIDFCDRNFTLSRTNYEGWNNDIDYKLVFREVGGSSWKFLSLFEYNDLYLNLNNLNIDFEVKVRATDLVNGFTSSSNSILIQFGDDRSLDTFYITKVEFTGDSTLLEWYSSRTSLVKNYELQFSEGNGVNWNTVRSIRANGGGEHLLWLKNRIAKRLYRLRAISDCGDDLGLSNTVRVIDVSIQSTVGESYNKALQDERTVHWNSFIEWDNGIEKYEVNRFLNGIWSVIGTTNDTFYVDAESLLDISVDSGICYRIKGIEKDPILDFKVGEVLTSSKCIFFKFHGDLPNAMVFTNTEEKLFEIPVENLDTSNSYLIVYNRWGEEVFKDGLKWNGGFNNEITKPCPSGVYYYVARVQLRNRDFYFVSSTLNVLR
ncbi:MAG: gliding motility-associated C-terminal domain-containing protein [Bacteroidia bacterium]